jgi:arsenite oxidase small subunit
MSNKDNAERKESNSSDRRNFLKLAVAFSALLVAAGIGAITKAVTNAPSSESSASTIFPKVKVATLDGLEINQPVLFNYPLDNEPNVLVKLGQKAEGGVGPDSDIVAFSALCQHLGCVYAFQATGTSPQCDSSYTAESPVGYCCCHGTVFDFLHGGTVQAGPSPRPVPQVTLEVDASGNIYAVGMTPPTIFGHDTGSNNVSSDLQGGNPVSTS